MISILTGPIRTGKTTCLMHIFKDSQVTGGFLCPDINGVRHVFCLKTKQILPLESDSDEVEETEKVGKFIFKSSSLNFCRETLLLGPAALDSYFIIDEIGKMELEHRGLEPALSKFLSLTLSSSLSVNIILVIRDSLLEEVIQKYNLQNARLYTISSFASSLQ